MSALVYDRRRGWLDQAQDVPLTELVAALGLDVVHGRTLRPCPACGAEQRGSTDRRSPVGLTSNGRGWRCHRGDCNAGGDAIDLASWALGGARFAELDRNEKGKIRAWYADCGWCAPAPGHVPMHPAFLSRRPPAAIIEDTRQRPPPTELTALWAASAPVDRTLPNPDIRPMGKVLADLPDLAEIDIKNLPAPLTTGAEWLGPEVSPAEIWPHLYLADRQYHPPTLARLDVVRIMPLRAPWPSWWPSSWAVHYRLAVLAYEPDGTPASLHARAVSAYDFNGQRINEPKTKTRWPKGCTADGLLFADPGGLALLRGESPSGLRKVWIGEGLTDLLRAALIATEELEPRAVLCATSGGFRALQDVCWPDGLRFYATTDNDSRGETYAREIAEALAPIPVYRYPLGDLREPDV